MDMGDLTSTNFLSYIQMFEHLISVGQILCGQTHGVANRLCQEVIYATQGRAQLLLRRPELAAKERVSSYPLLSVSLFNSVTVFTEQLISHLRLARDQ
jgi:hypothetical protein